MSQRPPLRLPSHQSPSASAPPRTGLFWMELSRSPKNMRKDRNSERSAWNACTRFCKAFLRSLEPTTGPASSMRAHTTNGRISLPLRAQCVGLESIMAPASATSLFRMLKRSLRQRRTNLAVAPPLTQRFKMAIRRMSSRRRCLHKIRNLSPEACGQLLSQPPIYSITPHCRATATATA